MKQAAVIGAGTMGNGIAHVLAQHEWQVALVDSAAAALDKARATIRANLDRQVKKGTLSAEAPDDLRVRLDGQTRVGCQPRAESKAAAPRRGGGRPD